MIGVYFPKSSMTVEQYKGVAAKINAGGLPEGQQMHTCFQEGDGLAVFDVWDSKEAFEAFEATLMPMLDAAGVTMSPPAFVEMVAFDVP